MHQTNIIVFNESDGYFAVPSLNMEYKHIVMIAYRYSSNGMDRNHYDSVAQLRQNDIFTCVENVVKQQINRQDFENINYTIEVEDELCMKLF